VRRQSKRDANVETIVRREEQRRADRHASLRNVSPLTFNVTSSGPAGRSSAYAVWSSIFTLPVGSFFVERIFVV